MSDKATVDFICLFCNETGHGDRHDHNLKDGIHDTYYLESFWAYSMFGTPRNEQFWDAYIASRKDVSREI